MFTDDESFECDFDGSVCGLNQEQMGDQDDWRVVSMSEATGGGINDHSTRTRKIQYICVQSLNHVLFALKCLYQI